MKLAVSNLILPAFKHQDLLPALPELGIGGLEVAPAHTWLDPWDGVPSADVRAYRKAATAAGLKIAGMHCLLSGRPDLGLFDLPGMGGRTINYLTQLSAICRDLGGKTLILGPRWRRRLTDRLAWVQGRAFLELLLPRIETHGTVLCFGQLGPGEGDFCTTARECYMLVNAVDHPAFRAAPERGRIGGKRRDGPRPLCLCARAARTLPRRRAGLRPARQHGQDRPCRCTPPSRGHQLHRLGLAGSSEPAGPQSVSPP